MALSEEIPQWALDRVEQEAGPRPRPECIPEDETIIIAKAFARYIMKREQPPVDPDVIAVREILAAVASMVDYVAGPKVYEAGTADQMPHFIAALTAYRKHKEAGE